MNHATTDELDSPDVHITSTSMLLSIFGTLVALTLLTVASASWLSGAWEIGVSIAIATMKATLVALYFMHLRYDRSFNTAILVAAIGCVGLFLVLALADYDAYRPTLITPAGMPKESSSMP